MRSVRSDVKISYVVREADGREHVVAKHDLDVPLFLDRAKIPHFHRIDSSGRWFATWDDAVHRMHIRLLKADGPALPQSLSVRGLEGGVRSFRWLHGSNGFSFVTDRGLWIARFESPALAEPTTAKRIELGLRFPGSVDDMRPFSGGLMVRARHRLFVVPNRADAAVVELTPAGTRITEASVRSDGRLVAVVKAKHQLSELWTWQTAEDSAPVVVGTDVCLGNCWISNWAPGTQRLVYATGDGTVVIEQDGHTHKSVHIGQGRRRARVHTLWTDAAEKRVLAATDFKVTVWTMAGEELWSFTPQRPGSVRSAHFRDDGSVLVATEQSLQIVKDGRAVQTIFPQTASLPARVGPEITLDDARPLGGGAIAFSVVRHEMRPISRRSSKARRPQKKYRRVIKQKRQDQRQQSKN